jgi:lysophospholipase L1-like esterase
MIDSIALRRLVTLVSAGSAAAAVAVAVPVVQGAVIARSTRPLVPGPHDQDGLVGGSAADGSAIPFVWLGDSLASGVGAGSANTSFPRRSAQLFSEQRERSVQLTCLAQPGAVAADVLAHQVPDAVARLGPGALAVVTVGANDVGGLRSPRQFKRTYRAILDELVATGATVVAVGLPDIGSAVIIPQPLRTLARFAGRRADRQVRRLATAKGVHFVSIDVRAPWRTSAGVYLAADRWHPNDDTYGLWAKNVAALVVPLLALGAP